MTKTAHQFARELLAGPDLPIFHFDPSFADACDEESDYTLGTPTAEVVDPREGIDQDEADSMESDGVSMGKFVTISGDQAVCFDRSLDDYNELIMAVARKFDGESRHETALRYIREAEERAVGGPAQEAR